MASKNAMLNQVTDALAQKTNEPSLALPDVLIRTAACLAVVIVAAVPGWIYLSGTFIVYLGILIVAMIVGFLIAKKAPVPAWMALGYSAILGLIVGAFSASAVAYGGNVALIPQAVVGTVAGTVSMLAVYATPFGKRASKATRLFLGIILGYMLIGFVSFLAAVFFNVGDGWGFYGVGVFGILLSVFGVALACWSLLIDIGQTDRALEAGAPRSYAWTFGVSLAASVVWLYLEILRLLAIVSGR